MRAIEPETGRTENTEDTASPGPRPTIRQPAIPPQPIRWMPKRKAEILAAVRRGTISLNQACEIYELSIEEFLTWQRGDALYGLAGLRATNAPRRRASGLSSSGPERTPTAQQDVSPAEDK
jgi:Protein of unknown function (DUF1153)